MWLSLSFESNNLQITTWYDLSWQCFSFPCQHCYLIVNTVTFCLVTKLTVTGLTNMAFCISFVLSTAPSTINHTFLRSFLRSFSSSRVHFVWTCYMLCNIVVTELTYQNLNMLLEQFHSFVTLQCSVLMSQPEWFCVQINLIVKM